MRVRTNEMEEEEEKKDVGGWRRALVEEGVEGKRSRFVFEGGWSTE